MRLCKVLVILLSSFLALYRRDNIQWILLASGSARVIGFKEHTGVAAPVWRSWGLTLIESGILQRAFFKFIILNSSF